MTRQARHFTVTGENFDGERKASVTIEPVGEGRWNMTIRPHRRRSSVTVSLGEVAARLLWQEAREQARKR